METLKRWLLDYWSFGWIHLMVILAVFLVMALKFRRVLAACCVAVAGVYASLTFYVMTVYALWGMSFEQAVGLVIAAGLVLVGTGYYVVFVRD